MTYTRFDTLPAYEAPDWVAPGKTVQVRNQNALKWGGVAMKNTSAPPAVGSKVRVTMNSLGTGTVRGYFAEHNWLGILVKLDDPPEWWREQNAANPHRLAHVFGPEFVVDQ